MQEMLKWLKDLGFGTILGMVVFVFSSLLLFVPFGYALSGMFLPQALKLGLSLGIILTLFGSGLLWLVYPLMGHMRLEYLAQRVAHLCVLFGLSLLFVSVGAALFSALLR